MRVTNRWKAAAIHLLISLLVILGVGFGLVFAWYGPEFFSLMGAQRLLTILAIVDIAIGPLLTLIVYKHGKKSLKFDLAVIALLQLGFLAYGLHIMWQSRPVFLVGVLDRFELVFANQLDAADLKKGRTEGFRTRSFTGPRIVGGALGTTGDERYDLAISGLSGKDIHLLPERYVPYEQVAAQIVTSAKPVEDLIKVSPAAAGPIDQLLEEVGRSRAEAVYVPVISSRGRATMLLVPGTGEVVGEVAVDPWPDLRE